MKHMCVNRQEALKDCHCSYPQSPAIHYFRRFLPLLFVVVGGISACSVPMYKVAPLPKAAVIEGASITQHPALHIKAAPVLDDDKSFERFETNLPLAGVLAVDIDLKNQTTNAITPKIELRDVSGKRYAPMNAEQTLKRIMRFESVRLYQKTGKQATLDQLNAIILPAKINLNPESQRQGVLFFNLKKDATKFQQLQLIVTLGREKIPIQF